MKQAIILSVIGLMLASPVYAQEPELDEEGCYYATPEVRICPPPVQKAREPLPGEPGFETPETVAEPTEVPTEELPDADMEGVAAPALPSAEASPAVAGIAEEELFLGISNRIWSLFWAGLGGVLGAAGIALFLFKPKFVPDKYRNGIAAAGLTIGLASMGGGCYSYFNIPLCEYVLVDAETLQPLGGEGDFEGFSRPEPLAEGAGMFEIAKPIPPVSDVIPPRSIRGEDERIDDCVDRCRNKDIYLYYVCKGEQPELVSKRTLPANEKANYCAAACGVESVLQYLKEAPVIS